MPCVCALGLVAPTLPGLGHKLMTTKPKLSVVGCPVLWGWFPLLCARFRSQVDDHKTKLRFGLVFPGLIGCPYLASLWLGVGCPYLTPIIIDFQVVGFPVPVMVGCPVLGLVAPTLPGLGHKTKPTVALCSVLWGCLPGNRSTALALTLAIFGSIGFCKTK
jgi:hypothetical protein